MFESLSLSTPAMTPEPYAIEPLDEVAFTRIRELIHHHAGIALSAGKRQLVMGRLQQRLQQRQLRRYRDYLRLIDEDPTERQQFIDRLTTNESYFFREPAHFDYLRDTILPHYRQRPLRIWSAACATGEEVWSLAMELADAPGLGAWSLLGSDISSRVLEVARKGLYPLERNQGIGQQRLQRYCLKGVGEHAGRFLIKDALLPRVRFAQINLLSPPASIGHFDLIFLRNVLIYFDAATKTRVITQLLRHLNVGGHLIISHTENLRQVAPERLKLVRSSIYRLE